MYWLLTTHILSFRRTNKRPICVLKDGIEHKVAAERICVGDIISLSEDDVVPCDAVILSTSHESHQVRSVIPIKDVSKRDIILRIFTT